MKCTGCPKNYRVKNPFVKSPLTIFIIQSRFTIYYSKATNNVEDFGHSTHLLGATTLRNVLGTKCLAEILSERSVLINFSVKDVKSKGYLLKKNILREKIAQWMEDILDDATDPWGVKVERVEM